MTNKLHAQIASLPDRENVVYEIYLGTDQVAEVSNEPDTGMRIEIFNCQHANSWDLDFNEFNILVEQSKKNISA
ncbi:hypothetical protein ABEI05_00550 [Erwinia billingiae]|jgi:hypothetical protein|uniref:Conserved uncharacterized protein n=1 Tax=Erwinia billingiae (strain Eb661) TaxID=634500 RepID=D8MSB7_ERWBE|nr:MULTISPECIES: hypothetical protein [Erwinia]QBR51774.1 hypothetical protein E2F51_18165 [Erwinia sp. QL-Z3]CAX59724.1 conserved uncharacterized protein [Erwinia billingiae Eb661]